MNPFYVGIPAWVVCTFSAYGLRERALGQMSAEQIGGLTLAQRGDRIKLLAVAVGLLLVFLAVRFGIPKLQDLWFLLLLAAAAALSAYIEVRGCKSALALAPRGPARTLVASRVTGLVGLLTLMGAMAATVL